MEIKDEEEREEETGSEEIARNLFGLPAPEQREEFTFQGRKTRPLLLHSGEEDRREEGEGLEIDIGGAALAFLVRGTKDTEWKAKSRRKSKANRKMNPVAMNPTGQARPGQQKAWTGLDREILGQAVSAVATLGKLFEWGLVMTWDNALELDEEEAEMIGWGGRVEMSKKTVESNSDEI
ncbi:hypothetical protein BDZ91DRAFT_797578 [Kalaharituber pfeilii]|nr:hypothetical protein BDZ91DRAFT_797578 [Kalaharituber pfeilii]